MDAKQLTSNAIETEAISIVKKEIALWGTATCFITPRVVFNMRRLIEVLRKNYYGVFDQPKDEVTGMDKVWYPLTEIMVEAVLDNIDLDTKDIDFRARNPKGAAFTDVVRAKVRRDLETMAFGETLDFSTRQVAIDGTVVWKTQTTDGKKVRISQPDLLNVFLDPTSPSIKDAYRFTERHLMYPEDIEKQAGWINTKNLSAGEGIARVNNTGQNTYQQTSNVKMRDVYELWGKVPEYLITGKPKDTEECDAHIIVSGLDTPNEARVHLIERNTEKDADGCALKPYEECWYTRVPNRWYGRGIAEKVLMLQLYANLVFNYRLNRGRVSQMGIFKMKKTAGLTPQSIQRLVSNGVVQVNNMDDLQQLVVQDVAQSSYNDEEVINNLSQKLTNAFSIATGEGMPASTPATNAAIQNQNSQKGFTRTKEAIGLFLERWVNRQYMPRTGKSFKRGELVQIMNDLDNYKEIVDRLVVYLANESLDAAWNSGYVPTEEQVIKEMENAREKLRKTDTFVRMSRSLIANSVEARVAITNEAVDINKQVANILTMVQMAPEYREAMIRMSFDLMGLPQPAKSMTPPVAAQGAVGTAPAQSPLAIPNATLQL